MKKPHRRPASLADELYEDDGVDPRTAFSRLRDRTGDADYKALQLSKAARRAIETALATEMNDPLLNDLEVVDLQPVAGGSHLRVSVRRRSRWDGDAAVAQRLHAARGFLRARVAESVSRRKAPELSFVVLPPHESEGGAP